MCVLFLEHIFLTQAPEILESRDYDGKADVWSVGCIFYEMLVGTSPFKGTSEPDLLMNIKTKELNVPKDVILSKVSIEILIKVRFGLACIFIV